jgi:ABC-type dipeptide/oligopeptide/nickel transport system permease subunit
MPTNPIKPPVTSRSANEAAITGVMAMQGAGAREPKGFWADAWGQVFKQPIAVTAIIWIAFVGLLAVFAPVLASGHPITMLASDPDSGEMARVWPLFANLTTGDWLLLVWAVLSMVLLAVPMRVGRGARLGWVVASGLQFAFTTVISSWVRGTFEARDVSEAMRSIEQSAWFPFALIIGIALLVAVAFSLLPTAARLTNRLIFVGVVGAIAVGLGLATWERQPELFDYRERIAAGVAADPVYTIVPWSPAQQFGDRKADRLAPGATATSALANSLTARFNPTAPIGDEGVRFIRDNVETLPLEDSEHRIVLDALAEGLVQPEFTAVQAEDALKEVLRPFGESFVFGTDGKGQDVLSQLVHASRLAISIGLVSTGIAVVIGVTLGALMGYFGGIVDMLLYRVVEVFMAVPVLFILIVAAGLLENPSTYVMMAIIGCFTWHSAARFVRAEFYKLRNQDFVQSAKAVGLPLRSILFKHMLPNGVTPVLVDASFAIALAIHFEATLSFLGLGPVDQASWGRLLADSTGDSGDFKWWLAVFPGGAIFLTALSYNLMGEALRDAIDPKLKKARV